MSAEIVTGQDLAYVRDSVDITTVADLHGVELQLFWAAWYLRKNSAGANLTLGALAPGPFFDETGNGRHLEIKRGATPTARNFGLELNHADGLTMGVVGKFFPASGTLIMLVRDRGNPALDYLNAIVRPDDFPPATPADDIDAWSAPHPTMTRYASAIDNSGLVPGPPTPAPPLIAVPYDDTHGIYDQDKSDLLRLRRTIPKARVKASEWNVVYFRWNNTIGRGEYGTLVGGGRVDAFTVPVGYWAAWPATQIVFGIFPAQGLVHSAMGDIGAILFADSLLADRSLARAMWALARMKYHQTEDINANTAGIAIQGFYPSDDMRWRNAA